MRERLFVDTSFLVARYNPDDRHYRAADELLQSLAERSAPAGQYVLTDYVFDEVITTILARTRRHSIAASAGTAIRRSRAGEIFPITPDVLEAAWKMFLERPDKLWSLTDCTSFVVMDAFEIETALAFDDNFRQAGFTVLP